MMEEELKHIWQSANERQEIINFHSLNLKDMNQQIKEFEKRINARNNREIFAAILGIILFGYNLFSVSTKLELLGGIWAIGYCLWVIYILKSVEAKQPNMDLRNSIKQQLLEYREYVRKEQQLLKNILYWYLLPAIPGLLFFMLGKEEMSFVISEEWPNLFFPFSILLFMFLAIYLLNKEAADKEFTPLLTDIEKTLKSLEQ